MSDIPERASDTDNPGGQKESCTQAQGGVLNVADSAQGPGVIVCTLCNKWLQKPRVLPCIHSFCERCLKRYIEELLPEVSDQNDAGFRCPACRYHVRIHVSDTLKSSWVSLFPTQTLLITVIERLRLQNASKCDPCCRGNEEREASSWCRECGEALCEQCTAYHGRVKLLMEHAVLSLKEIRNKPNKTADNTEICLLHRQKNVEAVCLVHDKLCCVDCVAYLHQDCRRVLPITDVSPGIRNSKYIQNLTERLQALDSHLGNVVDSRTANVSELTQQQNRILKEVETLREEVTKHLDDLESRFRQEFEIMHSALIGDLNNQSTEFSNRYRSIKNGENVLNTSLLYGTDENVFVLSHKLKKLCEEYEHFIKSESRTVYHYDYEVKINEILNYFASKISTIGDVSIKKTPTNIVPAYMRDMVAVQVGEIDGRVASDSQQPWFTSGLFLSNGNLLLADFRNKKIKSFDKNNTLTSELLTDYQPWAVAESNPGRVIVTAPEEAQMYVIKVGENGEIESADESIETEAGCHDVHVFDDRMFVACSTEIRVMTKSGEHVISIADRGTRFLFPSSECKLCYTTKTSMFSLATSGKVEFEYNHKDLKSPRGVTRDKEGNYYICGMDSNNIHQLTSDGRFVKVITGTMDDPIKNPYAVGFEPNSTRLFVTEMDSSVVKIFEMITKWQD